MAGALELMSELKCDGCQFALDDFGGILSSCGYLKALPVNYLKIGGNFVKSLDTQNIDFVMVQSINEVGHAIQLKTIVEFVKTRATLDKLKLLGVDFAQGYAVGRPTRALKEPGEQSS